MDARSLLSSLRYHLNPRAWIGPIVVIALVCAWVALRAASDPGDGRHYGFPPDWKCTAGARSQGLPTCIKSPPERADG